MVQVTERDYELLKLAQDVADAVVEFHATPSRLPTSGEAADWKAWHRDSDEKWAKLCDAELAYRQAREQTS